MSQNTVSVNGLDVASSQTQPTNINIHVHQESALAQLIKTGSALKQYFSQPSNTRIGHAQLSLGVTEILLGLLSCALGGFLYMVPWTMLRGSGCAFWAGAVAIVAGAGVIVHEKHPGKCSGFLSSLITVIGVAAALVAGVLCVHSLISENDRFYMETVCSQPDPDPFFTTSPPWGWRRRSRYYNDDVNWNIERCKNFMKMLVLMFTGIRVLLLVIFVLQAAGHGVSLGMGLRSMFSRSSLTLDQEDVEKRLLGQNSVPPSPSKEKIMTNILL